MQKQTKATAIKLVVKEKVWERDGERCVLCGRWVPVYYANAHFIPRSRGGLGIEQNLLTLCTDCHRRYDQGTGRAVLEDDFREYLKSNYPDWNEKELIYKWEL